ncbi:hypothetical protein [Dysgonomonas sp. 25]|uniref:hypothetical protein n=1 Tax=Dysgonomonas sp. 25 TaxID=2302933 RepID=UPI0013D0D6E5|nr:hypothetical protein [Dysgonomonas sp. 25]NDV68338.1 hypothetical protein [Dysgonomonas sp. 25]
MSKEKDMLQYDEDDAVKYIRNYLSQEMKETLNDDDINYIIDIVYDFYDSKGLMDEQTDDDTIVEVDEDEMIAYILKNTKKDGARDFTAEEVTSIVQGELAYCESIGMFE